VARRPHEGCRRPRSRPRLPPPPIRSRWRRRGFPRSHGPTKHRVTSVG
jgi:hypothetical protein